MYECSPENPGFRQACQPSLTHVSRSTSCQEREWRRAALPLAMQIFTLPVLLMPSGVSAQNPGAQTPVVLPGIVVTGSTGSAISPDVQTAKQLLDHYPGATSLVTSQDFSLGRGSYLED